MIKVEMSELIKKLRKEKGLTLEEVGNRVGVGKSTVRKWESGQIANMRRDKIALLAAALGVTPSYLMGWDEEKQEPKPAQQAMVLSLDETRLVEIYRDLNVDGKRALTQQAELYSQIENFRKDTSSEMA